VKRGCDDSAVSTGASCRKYSNSKLADPAGRPFDILRGIRDEIRTRIEQLITELPTS
jgi:arsenate reductase